MQLRIGNFMYYFKKGFYMIRKNLHMKIKRIFCGILTAAMLAFMNYWNEYYWASMVQTLPANLPLLLRIRIPNIMHRQLIPIPLRVGRRVLKLRRSQQFSWT